MNKTCTLTPERFIHPLRVSSLEILRQSLERTEANDKNSLEFEESYCILSMEFLCYPFDFSR